MKNGGDLETRMLVLEMEKVGVVIFLTEEPVSITKIFMTC